MRLPWSRDSPFMFSDLLCELFFGFPLHSRARLCLMMGLTFLWPTPWFSLFLTMLYCYSCRNNLILLGLFWASHLFLLLGLNGFCSLSFANYSMLLGWASFLTFGFHKKKKTLNTRHSSDVNHLYRLKHAWQIRLLEFYLKSNSRETNIIHLSINNYIMCMYNKNQQ